VAKVGREEFIGAIAPPSAVIAESRFDNRDPAELHLQGDRARDAVDATVLNSGSLWHHR
jgi:hypothetical protein